MIAEGADSDDLAAGVSGRPRQSSLACNEQTTLPVHQSPAEFPRPARRRPTAGGCVDPIPLADVQRRDRRLFKARQRRNDGCEN